MRTEQLTECFEPLQKKRARLGFKQITDRSKALRLMWFSVLIVLVSVSVMFHLLCA